MKHQEGELKPSLSVCTEGGGRALLHGILQGEARVSGTVTTPECTGTYCLCCSDVAHIERIVLCRWCWYKAHSLRL